MLSNIGRVIDRAVGGYEEIPRGGIMGSHIDEWLSIYQGEGSWVDNDVTRSLGLASSVTSELARLTTIEMRSEISRDSRLNSIYQEEVIDRLREHIELGLALGGMVMKPYIDRKGSLRVEFVNATDFIPLTRDFTDSIFLDRRGRYLRIERHRIEDDSRYIVTNECYEVGGEGYGTPTLLGVVSDWDGLSPETIIEGIDRPLYSYFRVPSANVIDPNSPLGISVYARAVDLIEEADKQYSRILWEYEGSELMVHISPQLAGNRNRQFIPERKERLFLQLDGDDDLYNVYNPEIRDESLFNGLNRLLQRVEFSCGLAYGTLSDVQMVDKTATEIKSSKQRSFSTVRDLQKSLELTLEDLVEVLLIYGELYDLGFIGDITEEDLTFEFDDSIVVDSQTEQTILLQEVTAGIISREEYLMRRYGVSREQAIEMMPNDSMESDIDVDTEIFDEEITQLTQQGTGDREQDTKEDK